MGLGVLNVAMLAGLAATALPVVVHLLSRRRDPVISWGAMQFLDLSPKSRRRIMLADQLLMLARMLILGAVALALARPFWTPRAASAGATLSGGAGARRDVVIILDGSSSMGRRVGGSTPRERAIGWAKGFIAGLSPGDSVGVLVAKDRVRPLVDPPSFDMAAVVKALDAAPEPRGASDLSEAVGEAFRILERPGNPAREVIVLTDSQRSAWRPGEPARWSLLRELRGRMPIPPRLWSLDFGRPDAEESAADGSIASLTLSRSTAVPGLPLTATATVANAGPGPLTRSVELLVDGRPAAAPAQVVGPIPAGGRVSVSFRLTLDDPGGRLLTARLAAADDPNPGDDEASMPVEVAPALPALLVDGDPARGRGPLRGETDFLRIALAPRGDDAPIVRATVVDAASFLPAALAGQKVVVLANVDRLAAPMQAALGEFVAAGGGLLIAAGDRVAASTSESDPDWTPAFIGERKAAPATPAHPLPRTFQGPALGPLAATEPAALLEADLFAPRVLTPKPGAAVLARLDDGSPWIVERPHGKGRVVVVGTSLGASGGTLPVNPDFVPLVHELILNLASEPGAAPAGVRPGEPIVFDVPAGSLAPGSTLELLRPDGSTVRVAATRAGDVARVRYAETSESGVYRLTKPSPPGGHAYALVVSDPREADPARLDPAEASKLSEDWPLSFEPDPTALAGRIASSETSPRHEAWRFLIVAALAGLCLEVALTRRMVKARGLA